MGPPTPPGRALTRVFDLSGSSLGFTVATALIGTIVGAAYAGLLKPADTYGRKPADTYGRKPVLFAIGILYVVSALGSALATDWVLFMIFRFIGGVGVGAATAVAPIYNAEVAPPKHRGRLVGLFQFNIVVSILLAYLSNFAILASSRRRRRGAGCSGSRPSRHLRSSCCCSWFRRVRAG